MRMVLSAPSVRSGPSDHEPSMASDLLTAAKNGYYKQVVSLLSSRPCDVNARDKDKATPLYWSASRGHVKICELLITQAGCDVNACVKWGSTALHAAADRGHVDCLTLLIDSGAQVNVQNERGDTALHLAAYRGFKEIVQVLVNAWADPFAKNGQSKTPLQEAQSQQHAATAAVLLKYMESLGCHPFKSLPEFDTSKSRSQQSCQGQPSSSVPTASWPRYQSFPKMPDNIPPTELARPHTHPIQGVNNLSGGGPVKGGSRTVSGPSGLVRENGGGGGVVLKGTAFGELEDVRNPESVHRHKLGSLHHVQRAGPQEQCEDNYAHLGHHHHHSNGGGGGAGRGHLVTSPQHQGKAMNQNGQGRALRQNGQDDMDSMTSFLPPPGLAPSNPHGGVSLVKHEDLTQFAESLQLEVVKLREQLSDRERQVSQLQTTLASLTAQNAQLHKLLAADAGKKSVSQDALSAKDSQLAELREKVCMVERQNACLQQALAQEHARSKESWTRRDDELCELTAKVKDLERLNSSLQQLIVTQQDTLKKMLAGKDAEVDGLRKRLEALCQELAALKGARRQGVHVNSAVSERTLAPSSESSGARSDSALALGQSLSPGETRTSQAHSDTAGTSSAASASNSVMSYCDQSLTHTHHTQADSFTPHNQRFTPLDPVLLAQDPASVPRPLSTVSSSDQATASSRESQQAWLRAAVSRQYQEQVDTGKLDADGREWTVGREFQLLDATPVNCPLDGQRNGSCSLVFSIGHRGRKYMLKMLMNLINLSYEAHSLGRSLDAHLLHRFGAEFHAPLLLHPHPNIVRVRHHYQGDTSQFRAYLPLLVPASLDVPVEMARRTTFLVLEQYPQTLRSFLLASPLPLLPEVFLLQLLYQLLSAVASLQAQGVVHRDIKADNVFLDWRLRPVLGDFGFARTLRGYGAQPLPFSDQDQVFAGNPHAWAPELSRWSRCDPAALPQPMSLEDVYAKSDGFAVARMFYHLLGADSGGGGGGGGGFPTSTQNQPHYPDSALPALPQPVSPALGRVLRSLALDDPARRPSTRQALCRVGVLLCKPSTDLTSPQAADEFYTSQLHRLSSKQVERPNPPEDGKTLSVTESVAANQNHCLADFLLSFSSREFWETYSDMRADDQQR